MGKAVEIMKAARYADTPWFAAACVAVLFLAVLLLQLSAHNQDPSTFIVIGDKFIRQPDKLPKDVHILPDSWGYDGQFNYQIALNPFAPQEVNAGLAIDNGPYRQQRILYPFLAWLLSFGNRALIPASLVIVNYLALCAIAWLGGRYSQLHQRHALWGTLFALYPGFLFTLTRDLTEIVSAMFLLAAVITLYRSQSALLSALLLTLAVLGRETALVAVIALAITLARRNEPSRPKRLLTVAIPLACFMAWQIVLWSKWGRLPVLAGGQNLGFPGLGLLTFVRSLETGYSMHRVWGIELALVAFISAIVVLVALRDPKAPDFHKLAWLGYAMLALSLTARVWVEDIAFMRAMSELYLFGLILIVATVHSSLVAAVAASSIVAVWALACLNRLIW